MSRRVAIALFLALLVALLVWLLTRDGGSAPPAAPPAPPPTAPAAEPAPAERPTPRVHSKEPEAPPAPPPVPETPAVPTLTGRVIDADGRPVAGAVVVSHPDDLAKPIASAKAEKEGSRAFVAKTDADGRFAVRIDERGVQLVLTVDADAGFGQAAAGPKDRDVEIRLVKWAVLTGRVSNVAKEPVAGAKVALHLLYDALVDERTAVSDANGDYRIERLPPLGWLPEAPSVGRGRHGFVVCEAEGYAPLFVEGGQGLGGPPGAEVNRIDLFLVRGMTLSGHVVDADTKAPLSGATVVAWSVEGMTSFGSSAGVSMRNPWGPRPLGEGKSGEDGSFRFEHLPARGPSGVASHNLGKRGQTLGHVAVWKEGYVYGGDEIPVSKEGTVFETTIELWPSATVTGRVVDTEGKPVEGASVYANVEARRPSLNGFPDFYDESRRAYPKSDADGRYTLTTFRASRSSPTTGKVYASARRNGSPFTSSAADVTAAPGETVAAPDIVIDFASTPLARILVTDERGEPVVGAEISRQISGVRTGLDGRAFWTAEAYGAKADAPIEPQSAVVRARGFAPQQIDFTPTRGTPVEVAVTLRPGARISGRVLRAEGGPAKRAQVVVADGTKTAEEVLGDGSRPPGFSARGKLLVYLMITAAEDGSFEATQLPDGPYLVVAQTPSRTPGGFNRPPKMLRDVRSGVSAGVADLVLTIPADDAPPTQAIELVVSDAAGGTVERCSALGTFGGLTLRARPTGPTTLRFDAVPAGRGTIDVEAPGWARATLTDVEVPSDRAPAPIQVTLNRGISLRGVVRGPSDALTGGGTLLFLPLERRATSFPAGIELQRDGSFAATGFLPGRYRVTANPPVAGPASESYTLAGDGIVTVPEGVPEVALTLSVVRAGTISFVARDPRLPKSPFGGGASDLVKDKFGAASRIEITDASGAVVFVQTPLYNDYAPSAVLAPGEYTVRLFLSGEPPQEQRCTVTAGGNGSAQFPAK